MLHALINDEKQVVKFPISPAEIRAIHPDVSFPPEPWDRVDLRDLNIINVTPTATVDMPVPDEGMKNKLVRAEWNEDGTALVRVYEQVPATPPDAG